MGVCNGYILTRTCREDKGRHQLLLAGTGDQGPFEICMTRDRPLFFVMRSVGLPAHLPPHERRQIALTTFDGRPVDALYFNSRQHLFMADKSLKAAGIITYEADVRPEDRFLMERFIYGGISITGAWQRERGMMRYVDPVIAPADVTPPLSILSLDIETGRRGNLYSIGVDFTPPEPSQTTGAFRDTRPLERTGLVLMWDPGAEGGDPSSHDTAPFTDIPGLPGAPASEPLPGGGRMVRLPREQDLLFFFMTLMDAWDPDILIGWHVVGFDLSFLERRAKALSLSLNLGRDGSPLVSGRSSKGGHHADIYGRIVIDGPPALRNAFYTFDNFKLETVARSLLGRGKDISGTGRDKVAQIERRFRQDKPALAVYNLMDAVLVTDIFKKTGMTALTLKRAQISGLTMDRVGMSVAAFDHFMLPRIHRKGLVAPNVRDLEDRGHAPGGLVFATKAGFYDQIAVFDFKSLYPSIIRTFHIDPLSRLRPGSDPLKTPSGICFSRSDHVLPDYIRRLMEIRAHAVSEGDKHLSQAVKILMNSFYGVMGTLGCRFYHPDLSRGITETGQWVLRTTRTFLEKKGYTVIYGDTDSVFVSLRGQRELPVHARQGLGGGLPEPDKLSGRDTVPEKEARSKPAYHATVTSEMSVKTDVAGSWDWDREARQLAQSVNTFLKRTLTEDFGADSRLELEFEKRFSRFFLPAVRKGGASARKRYTGMVVTGDTEELVFTGLEFVRSDWTRFARQFQYDLFQRIFSKREIASWIRNIEGELRAGRFDPDLVYKKRLTKPADQYVKTIPPHVRAALMLGDTAVREILYVMTLRGPVPVELPHDDLDYTHYIQKQLRPIADAVLPFLGMEYTRITGGHQLSLF